MTFVKWRNLLAWHILRSSGRETVCGLGLVAQSKVDKHIGLQPPGNTGKVCRLCDRLKAVKQQTKLPLPGEVRR